MELTLVVPIYNVERYLQECLQSFVNQTDQNFSVVLIDDGSTDNSPLIAKNYVEKYPHLFKYFRQENKGLGGARNTGLKLVKTDYAMFFDSDDFMANKAIENINNFIAKTKSDIIMFNPVIYDQNTDSYLKWHDKDLILSLFKENKEININTFPILHRTEASVCRSIFKISLFQNNNILFPEKIRWEDVPVHFLLMHYAKSVSFLDYEGAYYYRINSENQITAGSGKTRLEIDKIFNILVPFFDSKDWSKKEKLEMLCFLSNYILWFFRTIDDEYRVELVNICHKFTKNISYRLLLGLISIKGLELKNVLMMLYLRSNRKYKILYSRDAIGKRMNFFKKIKRIFKK